MRACEPRRDNQGGGEGARKRFPVEGHVRADIFVAVFIAGESRRAVFDGELITVDAAEPGLGKCRWRTRCAASVLNFETRSKSLLDRGQPWCRAASSNCGSHLAELLSICLPAQPNFNLL